MLFKLSCLTNWLVVIKCVLRWLPSSVGITAGIHRVRSTVPKCWSIACSTQKFPWDTEHSSYWQLQPVQQRVDEVVRWAEGPVWPSWHRDHGRARADSRNKGWRNWVCWWDSPVVTCMASLEKYWHFGDKSCWVIVICASKLRSISGISHGTRVDVSGSVYAHSLAVCCRGTAASVCRAAAGVVRPGCSFFDAVLCCTHQQ